MWSDRFVKLFGYKASILLGNPATLDRFHWLQRHLLRGPVRTLDAGCGSGYFTFFASLSGNESLGISFDDRMTQTARARAKTLNINNIQFATEDLRTLH